MRLTLITYPDKRLKNSSKEVTAFDKNLHSLLDGMYKIMMKSNGIGLAAIQVAVEKRVLLLNLPDQEGEQSKENLLEIINPKIVKKNGTILYQEGCLSVPGFYEDIERFEEITLEYQNRIGETFVIDAEGLFAVAIQHEMDHLEGKLFIEKLSYSKRKKFEKEYKRAQKEKEKR